MMALAWTAGKGIPMTAIPHRVYLARIVKDTQRDDSRMKEKIIGKNGGEKYNCH